MDQLKSEQDRLCSWLSGDPDYIMRQCGDILSMNEFLEVQQQSSALDKMRVLLKTILHKGGDTPRCFLDILRQHQAHYQQLQQLFNPTTEGSPTATVLADSNSVVTVREITNVKVNSLSMKIETVSDPVSGPTENAAGQVPPAVYTAHGASVICADKISRVTTAGDIDLSVSVKTSKGSAVKLIIEHKMDLIDWLRADHAFILQHVHARRIVTDRQYQNLKHLSQPEKTVTNLIDQVIFKGQESCSLFLEVLKEPDVLMTYPQLKEITKRW